MTIIVGLVPTPAGRAALDAAIEEAAWRGAHLVIVNTSRGAALVDADLVGAEELAAVTERLDAHRIAHEIRQNAGVGDPVEQLLAAVVDLEAELLVIGMRHRSPVGKLILGSSAQRLLLDSPCPVLAVKGPARETAPETGRLHVSA